MAPKPKPIGITIGPNKTQMLALGEAVKSSGLLLSLATVSAARVRRGVVHGANENPQRYLWFILPRYRSIYR